MRILRVRRHRLQAPVLTYRRRGRRGDVTLVGVSHVGEVSYYLAVAALIDRLETRGAAVHYEMIGDPPQHELDTVTAEDRTAIDVFKRQHEWAAGQIVALMLHYGWTYQTLGLAYPDRWRNTDMHALQLIRALGTDKIRERDRPARISVGEDDLLTTAGFAVIFRLIAIIPGMMRLISRLDSDSPVIVGQRNVIALGALPAHGDVVLIWGADHLRGITRELRRAGFQRVNRIWLTVGTLPPLRRSLAGLTTAMRQLTTAMRYDQAPRIERVSGTDDESEG